MPPRVTQERHVIIRMVPHAVLNRVHYRWNVKLKYKLRLMIMFVHRYVLLRYLFLLGWVHANQWWMNNDKMQ
jgi:hypothetical protein